MDVDPNLPHTALGGSNSAGGQAGNPSKPNAGGPDAPTQPSANSPATGPVPGNGPTTDANSTSDETSSKSVPAECASRVTPGSAPLRRLTRFEYNNTVAALLGDTSRPGNSLPSELLGNGYGNDAYEQPISPLLAEQYGLVAADIAARATATPEALAKLAPCASTVTAATETACARSFIESFAPRAYRHPLQAADVEELLALYEELRENSQSFAESIDGLLQAILQTPDFLYRLEFGVADATNPELRRPSPHEMASRLSYLFWGTLPDAPLQEAALAGELSTPEGVYHQAQRLLADERSRPVVRNFFSYYLPLNTLTDLARDETEFPTFSPAIGGLMREETHRFLEYEIFQGPGDWPSILTAPYTFVNERLANFYGIPGVVGEEFRKVDVDTTQRLGLLTQGGIQAGTAISNFTNPVRRGVFLLRHLMCINLPEPPETLAENIMPPDPYTGATGRERYSAHSQQAECAGCHAIMDPPGFALENYDAVGLWRDQENGVTIDASGNLGLLGAFSGPLELVQLIAQNERTHACLAENWLNYAYGRTLGAEDECTRTEVEVAFAQSNYDVQSLLLSLTQTDAFLYLPQEQPR